MRHVVLTEYLVGAIALPLDAGGGRLIQIGAKDRSELIEIAVDDETWDAFVQTGDRVHIAAGGDVAKFQPHAFVPGPNPGLCGKCGLNRDALSHGSGG